MDENAILEKRILEHLDKVPSDLFSEWSGIQQKMGEHLADAALCFIAQKYDSYILANPVNSASYAHFIRSDVQSKTFTIRTQTLRTGIRSGFLESEVYRGQEGLVNLKSDHSGPSSFVLLQCPPKNSQNLTEHGINPLIFWIQGEQFYAVERGGEECLVKQMDPSDRPLFAARYEDGAFIVSDIDLVSIFSRTNSDDIQLNPTYGELTDQELTMIQDVNRYFQELVSSHYALKTPPSFRLIAHGPANRFSNSKISHLHYPMKIYTPHSSIEFLNSEFPDFYRKMQRLGYYTYLNPKWEY